MDAIMILLTSILGGVLEYGSKVAAGLLPEGEHLAGLLLIILIVWTALHGLIEQADMGTIIAGLVKNLLISGIVMGFLGNYQAWVVGGIGGSIDGILDIIVRSSNMQIGPNGTNGALMAGLSVFSGSMMKMVGYVHQIVPDDNVLGALDSVVKNIVSLALVFLTICVIALSTIFYYCAVLMSAVMFASAVAFGPIMIPWLLWPATSFLFDGWLKFLISACFYKIVALFMVGACGGLFQGLSTGIDQVAQQSGNVIVVSAVGCLFLMAMAGAIAFMLTQIGMIANGLVHGNAIASLRFGGIPKVNKAPPPPKIPPPPGGVVTTSTTT